MHDGIELVVGHDLSENGSSVLRAPGDIHNVRTPAVVLVQRSRERLLTFGKSGEFFASSRDFIGQASRFDLGNS